jgi:hypothetical protein
VYGDIMWFYKGEVFTSEMIEDYVGFVYLITDKSNNKKYVGKKLLTSKRKLAPLKGKTRKRTVVKETDWQKYYGSSEEVKLMVEEKGVDNFHREILYLCMSKGQLGYLEAKYQFENDVLLRDDYYNGIIQCKIHRNHVRSLIAS